MSSVADDCVATTSDPSALVNTPAVRNYEVAALFVWLVTCSSLVFSRSFRIAYVLDDLDHLHALATLRSGQISFVSWLFLNHNEHVVPLLRLYFWVATEIGGFNAFPMHIMVLLTYAVGAAACASIAYSLTRSRVTAVLAGTIYAAAGGFAGSTVWQPTIAQFSLSGTPLVCAMALLVSRYRDRRWSLALALILVLIAGMGMGAAGIAALSIPAYLYLAKPRYLSSFGRKIAIAAGGLVSAAVLVASRLALTWNRVPGVINITWPGVRAGLFLIASAPGRFLLTWLPAADPGFSIDLAASACGWVLLAISWRWVSRPMRLLLLSLWIGDCLLALLIGIGRYQWSYFELWLTDRYYFFFLLPLALQTAAALEHITQQLSPVDKPHRKLAAGLGLGCILAVALVGAHVRLDRGIGWDLLNTDKHELRAARTLAKIIADKAARQKLHLADGPVSFPGVHKKHIALACVVFTQFPHGLPGVSWTFSRTAPTNVAGLWFRDAQGRYYVGPPWDVPAISEADAAVENQILDAWAQLEKRHSLSCMLGGRMQDVADPNLTSCANAAQQQGTSNGSQSNVSVQ